MERIAGGRGFSGVVCMRYLCKASRLCCKSEFHQDASGSASRHVVRVRKDGAAAGLLCSFVCTTSRVVYNGRSHEPITACMTGTPTECCSAVCRPSHLAAGFHHAVRDVTIACCSTSSTRPFDLLCCFLLLVHPCRFHCMSLASAILFKGSGTKFKS